MIMKQNSSQGFALVITLIFVSVVLALGVSLLDVAYKQILLSSSSRQSQYAFYNADSAMECALYYDQKTGVFGYDYTGPYSFTCGGFSLNTIQRDGPSVGGSRTTIYDVSCAGGGVSARVTVIKQPNGATNLYANGYNTCDSAVASRIERGLKVFY
jgi:Tfp pilus assembly protein PilE